MSRQAVNYTRISYVLPRVHEIKLNFAGDPTSHRMSFHHLYFKATRAGNTRGRIMNLSIPEFYHIKAIMYADLTIFVINKSNCLRFLLGTTLFNCDGFLCL